jgi:hypothetical protein
MLRALLPILLLSACDAAVEPIEDPTPGIVPLAASLDAGALTALHRLTQAEWRNSVADLLGVGFEGELPPDFVLHGYASVGAAEVTIAPTDFELYEAAAWSAVQDAVPDDAARAALLGCPVEPPLGQEDGWAGEEACVRAFLVAFLGRAWRRPATGDDVQRWIETYLTVVEATDRPTLGVQALLAGALLAPDFLFRVELGDAPAGDGLRWLDPHEQAARVALALLDRPADPPLTALADADLLRTPQDVAAAVALAVADPASAAALQRFYAEWLELDRLDLVSKDPVLYPGWNDALKAAMSAEMLRLFESVALDQDADLRTLLTTTDAYLTPELAALYGVPDPGDPTLPAALPPERAGILTRGAFLAVNAHPSINSPTHRGRTVRSRLLCRDVPPPPPGVVTDLGETDTSGTLRQQLEQHASDPQCSGCHDEMDPIGFAFEHFGPTGEWRETDRGFPIDATADLDGVAVDGGAAMGAAVADHDRLPACIANNAWAHLLGHPEQRPESDQLDAVTDAFTADGHRLSALLQAIAGTVAWRTVATPEGGPCERAEEGFARPCGTDCGDGEEVCTGGTWRGCSAPVPVQESCNGIDDDCDGNIDEVVFAPCRVGDAPGIDTCSDGAWTGCVAAGSPETCNGLDDDGDGEVDEGLDVDLRTVTAADITASHESCLPELGSTTPGCRAAVHRMCGSSCAGTGIGPVARDGDRFAVACLSADAATVVETSYTALSAQHGGCTQGNRFGSDCNAAIHRWCSSQGMTTGYGPVENSGDVAVVACNPGATTLETSFTALAQEVPGCDGSAQRVGPDCDEAFHRWCRAQGFATGHGPLENSGDVAWAACIGEAP